MLWLSPRLEQLLMLGEGMSLPGKQQRRQGQVYPLPRNRRSLATHGPVLRSLSVAAYLWISEHSFGIPAPSAWAQGSAYDRLTNQSIPF